MTVRLPTCMLSDNAGEDNTTPLGLGCCAFTVHTGTALYTPPKSCSYTGSFTAAKSWPNPHYPPCFADHVSFSAPTSGLQAGMWSNRGLLCSSGLLHSSQHTGLPTSCSSRHDLQFAPAQNFRMTVPQRGLAARPAHGFWLGSAGWPAGCCPCSCRQRAGRAAAAAAQGVAQLTAGCAGPHLGLLAVGKPISAAEKLYTLWGWGRMVLALGSTWLPTWNEDFIGG